MNSLKWLACLAFVFVVVESTEAQQRKNSLALYKQRVFEGMPCRLMQPFEFDEKGSYPVIISLHGAGGRGIDNTKQLKDWNHQLAEQKRRRDFPCYVVAPQAKGMWEKTHLQKIKSLVKTLPAVDSDRIYIMGHSMGGHGTYIFIQLDPDYFAAAAPSAGSGKRTTPKFIEPAKIKDIPIWAFHGDQDGVCPISRDRAVFNEMKKLGGNMKLTTWSGDNHGVSGKMVIGAENGKTDFSSERCNREPDFMNWLFSQSRRDSNPRQAGGLDELTKIQNELKRLRQLREQVKSAPDRERRSRIEANIDALEQHLENFIQLQESDLEIGARIIELNQLMLKIDGTASISGASRWMRYLSATNAGLKQLQKIKGELKMWELGREPSKRSKLESSANELEELLAPDEELVELISTAFDTLKTQKGSEIDDLGILIEISEFLDELENRRSRSTISRTPPRDLNPNTELTTEVTSGKHFILQTWSQEKRFRRTYFINVPDTASARTDEKKFPVLIFLHGNGGNAEQAMRNFLRNHRKMASTYVMVFPQGYRESWNIVSERSKADDVGFVESIVLRLAKMDNVNSQNFSIMGASNGAALVNQLLIESRLPNIRNYISGVSPLNVWQHDGSNFKAKGLNNNYTQTSKPMAGKRLLNISGTNDNLVPYRGGTSAHIPAKNGKLGFVDAEQSAFLWARQMGYKGKKLRRPSNVLGRVEEFSYLDGDVIHLKVVGAGHGATHEISEDRLLSFLTRGKSGSMK